MSSHRHRRHVQDDEDAGSLKLGPDFKDSSCLMISEVKLLLDATSERHGAQVPVNSPVYQKTLEFVNKFSLYHNAETAEAVRETLRKEPQLTSFEQAQLGNLACETVEEATTLIPSLTRIDEDTLAALLNEISTLRKFQS